MTTSDEPYKRIKAPQKSLPVDAVLFSSVSTSESSSSKSPIGTFKHLRFVRSSKLLVFALTVVTFHNARSVVSVEGFSYES